MLRWPCGFTLGLIAVSSSGCILSGTDCPPLKDECSGNFLVHHEYETPGECGIVNSWETDCTETGELCRNGGCSRPPPENPCPGGNGECRGETAFACNLGGLPDVGQDCAAAGLRCFEVPAWDHEGHVQATCALSNEQCRLNVAWGSTECRDNQLVTCRNGYPVDVTACEGPDVVCVDYDAYSAIGDSARCTYSVACPPDEGTFCRDNVVHGCDGGDSTVELRDCGADVCAERGERGLCTARESPPPTRFVRIPGGTFFTRYSEPDLVFGDFEMLEREVTVSEYATCVTSGACSPPDAECLAIGRSREDLHADLPVACVDFPRAQAFCATLGARLPTADEWRYALSNARHEYQFPCPADDAPCERTTMINMTWGCGGTESRVGCTAPEDMTTQGVCDLLGNASELVEHTPGGGVQARCGGGSCGIAQLDLLGPFEVGTVGPLGSLGFRCVR
jgi:hypothetical protein